MKDKIWDFWANRYTKLWVQKHSLGPTRQRVKFLIGKMHLEGEAKMLDIGCGVGELLAALRDDYRLKRHGLDFSVKMIEASKKQNPDVPHFQMDVNQLHTLAEKFDLITCTHSLPYYRPQKTALMAMHELLNPEGRAIFAFASGDTWLDKCILFFIKLTTGPAQYPSDRAFRQMIDKYFEVEKREVIKKRPYMPTISVYVLKKVIS